jgi:tetratricopeptide (TPR) repeat protein
MDISMTRRTASSSQAAQSALRKMITRSAIVLSTGSILLGSVAAPSWAGDPFGRNKPIGDKTEKVFRAIFDDGDYITAEKLIGDAEKAEPDEPLIHALRASLLFAKSANTSDTDKGNTKLFFNAAKSTQAAAEKLKKTDAARGNLYLAVGNFLESAHVIAQNGIVKGTPEALGKLTNAFQYLGEAEKLDSKDPEFNIMKGSMDLMLAVNVNLPLSDANAAIERVKQAKPSYISNRVLAWGFRDMDKLDDANKSVDAALKETPQNPELHYLKGQILVKQKKKAESVPFFKTALSKSNREKLPDSLKAQFCNDLRQVDEGAWKEVKCGG